MAQSFDINEKAVLMTGQPCNDSLFAKHDVLSKLGIQKDKYNKIVMWMPTYRKSAIGDIRIDGDVDSFGVATVLSKHRNELEKLLNSLGILLLIKPHPMDILCQGEFIQTNNIKIIKNENLENNDIVLYDLLAEMDSLLTDYSSVFIDYLVTGRPMAFICDDLDAYSNSRGFCFNPPEEYMPGELINNFEQLKNYFVTIDDAKFKWQSKYEKVKKCLNQQDRPNACEKICAAIWKN